LVRCFYLTGEAEYFYARGWTYFGDLPVVLFCRRHLSLQTHPKQCMRINHLSYAFSSDVPNARFHTERKRGNQECATAL
jgi:hypothetical protein